MPLPAHLNQAASVEFEVETPGFDSADSYTARLSLSSGAVGLELNSTTSAGATHTFTISAAAAAAWTPGRYHYELAAVKSGERWIVARGVIEIRAKLGGALDARDHLRRTLDAVEAVIERRASKEDLEITVPAGEAGQIQLKAVPLADLLKLRDVYRREIRDQEAAERMAAGLGNRRQFRVRFQGG